MANDSDLKVEVQALESASGDGVSRRRLIRAGLAATPVMLGLKTQSALATGSSHVQPSLWSSLKTAKGCRSTGPSQTGGTCKSYTYWKGCNSYPNFCNDHTKTRFHSVSNKICPPFGGSRYGSTKTMKDICSLGGADNYEKLARHCAAMYLNACEANNDTDYCVLTKQQCRDIWAANGVWTPVAGGPTYTINGTIEYFDYICLNKKPSDWTCA